MRVRQRNWLDGRSIQGCVAVECAVEMKTVDALALGRAAVLRRAWAEAYDHLSRADADDRLGLDDLEMLALAAYMGGKDVESASAWTRAHHECIRNNDSLRAARCAFWQASGLLFKGDMAPAMGWIARGRRLLAERKDDSAEQAWLLVLTGLPVMFQGDAAAALPMFVEADGMAARCGDRDVVTFARLGRGAALVMLRQTAPGLELMDEVMVGVTSGEVSPILAGIAYCQVIAICQEIFDLRRAREWTAALSRWCDSQPDLVPYRGNCLVHRSEILRLQGSWPAAREAAEQACELLGGPVAWDSLGAAFYELAEVHRLHGDFATAEEAYRRASEAGRDPEPGMSLLRLAQGRTDVAAAAIRRALGETREGIMRSHVLPAYVEIMLATGDVQAARSAADELTAIASGSGATFLNALSAQATGAVLLAEGRTKEALAASREAWKLWQEVEAPHEAARVRVSIALCCRALGDDAGAALDLEAARSAFQRLGAKPDAARVQKLMDASAGTRPGGLTAREIEVLALLATGKTNREISEALVISENTVARHVQNIFAKLDVSSRTAAGAFAFENDLV